MALLVVGHEQIAWTTVYRRTYILNFLDMLITLHHSASTPGEDPEGKGDRILADYLGPRLAWGRSTVRVHLRCVPYQWQYPDAFTNQA